VKTITAMVYPTKATDGILHRLILESDLHCGILSMPKNLTIITNTFVELEIMKAQINVL
jgi:hypothetical protein